MNTRTLLIVVGLAGLCPVAYHVARGAEAQAAVETYYADGSLKARLATEEGRPHGPCVRYWPDGTKKAEGLYEAGEPAGEWVYYTPDGRVDDELSGTYRDGRRVSGS